MKKLLDSIGYLSVELTAFSGDNHTDLHIKLCTTRGYLNPNVQDLAAALWNGLGIENTYIEDMVQRIEPVFADFSTKKNCTYSPYELFVRCYTEPQIERGYQTMLELWAAIKTAATTKPPRRLVAENKLKELFK